MSALSQNSTCASVQAMSALTPISDIGRHACYRCELGASARHKAANSGVAVAVVIRPHNGRAETVGLGHNGVVRHPNPFSVNADTIVAILCVPIDILQTDTVGKGAAQSVSTCKAVEPFLEGRIGEAAVVTCV